MAIPRRRRFAHCLGCARCAPTAMAHWTSFSMGTSSVVPPGRPLYLIHGTDGFRVRLRAHDLAAALVAGAPATADLAQVARGTIGSAPLALTRLSAREA